MFCGACRVPQKRAMTHDLPVLSNRRAPSWRASHRRLLICIALALLVGACAEPTGDEAIDGPPTSGPRLILDDAATADTSADAGAYDLGLGAGQPLMTKA